MHSQFFPVFTTLLLVLNPFSPRPVLPQAGRVSERYGLRTMAVTCGTTLLMLCITSVLGQALISGFALSPAGVQVSAGLILFLLAISMVFSVPEAGSGESLESFTSDAYVIVPNALAGVFLLNVYQQAHWTELAMALVCAMLTYVFILQLCRRLQHRFGFFMALVSVQRLMGLMLTAVAVDRILQGAQHYFAS